MQFNSYYNAKLLLTAEYLVLKGAQALAVPLRFGQRLSVEDNQQGFISWLSIAYDGSSWFTGKYALKDFSIIDSSNPDMAKHPQRLMLAARKLNPEFCRFSSGCHIVSTLNYPLLWGLGSSSTLIAAIAGWAGIDPFRLHFEVSKGSGYDIACAISNSPLLYTLRENVPEFRPVRFSPSFTDKIYFVYQGRKQDSAEGISEFQNRNSFPDDTTINTVNLLTDRMLNAANLPEFEQVMREHEMLISSVLMAPGIRQTMFSDLPGEVKSLGAWGGDFCMLTWRDDPEWLPAYLKSKNLETWFNFNDIVL
ncbi:MAG: GYDIA family GHMP kinase [Lentimicrobiaceae bacterium]